MAGQQPETYVEGGGGLVTTLKRSVSMNDLNQSDEEDFVQVEIRDIEILS